METGTSVEPQHKEMKYILWFDELDKSSLSLVGGKGKNLIEMTSMGLPVPEGFAVTTKAFEYFLEMNQIKEKINEAIKSCNVDDIRNLKTTSDNVKELIIKSEYPQSVKDEIKRAYEKLSYSRDIEIPAALSMISAGREYATVAVRSSATAEDLPGASFAGQQASFLNVKGVPYTLEAVKQCWASLYEPRAIFYRAKKGFKTASISVIVQRMVDADKAGVTFTVHPSTGEDVVLHEACWGLGESLVLGHVQPDRYILSDDGKLLEKEIGRKEIMHVKDVGGADRTVELRVPKDKIDAQVLTDEEIRKLTAYAVKIEEHYGKPQDIEWCIKGKKIYIVQTRPVTTLVPEEAIKTIPKIIPRIIPRTKEKIPMTEGEEGREEGKEILRGIAASPGIGSGPVKVVSSLVDAVKVVKGDVLVTEMTSPDFVPTMSKCVAIVTDKGGITSHASIVSREMGIPCVVGTQQASKLLSDGLVITVDGFNGVVYRGEVELEKEKPEYKEYISVEPAEAEKVEEIEKLKEMERELEREEIEEEIEEEEKPAAAGKIPIKKAKTKIKPKVYMNLGIPEKIDEYKNLPFEGIGLMRVEFIVAGLGTHPNALIEAGLEQNYIDALAKGMEKVAAAVNPRPVVVRFSDFKTNEYRELKGGEKFEPEGEVNPMLGWRGASRYVTPEFEEAFRLECRAVKKVREQYKNVWAMLPFVRTTTEVESCLQIMEEEGLVRGEEGEDEFQVWIMAEVPSVVFLAGEFAKLCDGFSIGSNDLTQLILGVDRDSEILGKLGYFDEQNLAVKMAIKHLIDGAHEADRTVSICGQAPSEYPEFVKFLVEAGIDSISVNPDAVQKTLEILESS